MYVLLILLLLFIVSWIIAALKEKAFFIITFITGLAILIMIISIFSANFYVDYNIQQRLVKKQLYEEYLKDPSKEAERVAFLPQIIEYNQEILLDRYWKNTQWGWWINDKYTKMELIK